MVALPPAKILLVDDKKENLEVLETLILDGDPSLQVITTTLPVEALKLALQHDFALILLDVKMPGMDGYQLAEVLRSQQKNADIPIIMISAVLSSQVHIFKGYEAGAVDYIIKPINVHLLHNKVRTFVAMHQHNQQLLQMSEAAKKLSNEALEARREADEANQAKTDFLATMSHEIRTPLNAIIGFSELMTMTERPLSEAQREEYQKAIHNGSVQLLALINNVLDFSKIESGHEEINTEHFALPELLDNIDSNFSHRALLKGTTFSVKVEQKLPRWIETDHTKVMQILNNLVGNAIKFTQDGGTIVLDVSCHEKMLTFKVIDNGPGLDPQQQEAVFNPFQQASARSNDNEKGTGLGLAISAKLARMIGGDLTLESQKGKGCCFTLSFPLVEVVKQNKIESDALPPKFAADSIVLVVDDVNTNLMLMTAFLKAYGCTAITLSSGQQAIEKTAELCLKGTPPELILMDIRMPGMDGIETATAILAEPASANVAIVGLSADVVADQIKLAAGVGFSDYLTKPLKNEDLHRVLARFLRVGL